MTKKEREQTENEVSGNLSDFGASDSALTYIMDDALKSIDDATLHKLSYCLRVLRAKAMVIYEQDQQVSDEE